MNPAGTGYIGRRILRVEDERLLRGHGNYTADAAFESLVHMVVLRSDHPAAEIKRIDAEAARAMHGVLGVWTGMDLCAEGLGGIPWEDRPPPQGSVAASELPPTGDPSVAMPQPVLASGCARYQGEPLAIVVAESAELARDAAEQIIIDYAPRPAVTDTRRAGAPDAPQVWPQFPGNRAFAIRCGDAALTDAAFARAAHVTRLSIDIPRLVQNPIEPRNYVGTWDADQERYTLYAAAGKPQAVGRSAAREIFRIPSDKIRVISRDVGGGFGSKNVLYPEEVLVLWAARKTGRPVRWLGSRSENFLSDTQARDQAADISLALDEEGRILGLRASVCSNLGAYLSPKGAIPPIIVSKILTGVYDIPAVDLEIRAHYTNTPPTGPYRGAGTPEAIFMIERAIDTVARELHIAPAELRRRNLIPASAMPFTTSLGVTIDSGDLLTAMHVAEEAADLPGFRQRREQSILNGKLRGIGYANMIEWAGVGPAESASVSCLPDGSVVVRIGSMSNGQSHQTVYAQMIADTLGIDIARIRILQGDSDEVPDGLGTGASRSVTVSGSAMLRAGDAVIQAGRMHAADMLEASPDDLAFANGRYRIAGTDRDVTLKQVAAHAVAGGADARNGLAATSQYRPAESTCPNGCHIAEVEVDPETGMVTLERYTIAQDIGRAINPMVVEAQLIGGVTQGIGQALLERAIFDPESGQLLSGSFTDYCMPRADDLPSFTVKLLELPCTHTPMGMKSCGEIGATGGPATTFNAVMDALAPLGITSLPMPATPHAVFQAIRSARKG